MMATDKRNMRRRLYLSLLAAVILAPFAQAAAGSAVQAYNVGLKVRSQKGDTPAITYMTRAIALDPDYPLPYAELTTIYRNLGQPSLALINAQKAYSLRNRASDRDQLKIAGIYFLAKGDLDGEVRNYLLWQSKYPRDFEPYNNLGDNYAAMGQLEKSLAQYQKALALMPGVIPYTNVVGMELNMGRVDAADASLREAFARKLDGRYLHQNLYWLAFLRGDTALMRRQLDWAASRPRDDHVFLSMQADTDAYDGRLRDAHEASQRAVNAALHAESPETAALWQVSEALREAEVGNAALARQGIDAALALSRGHDAILIAALAAARAGDAPRAQALIAELEKKFSSDALISRYWLPTINATMAINQGDAARALHNLEIAQPYDLSIGGGTIIGNLYPAYVRGQAYLLARQPQAAAVEFQKMLDHPGIVSNFVTGALAQAQLGRAWAQAGKTAKAKAAYQAFFTLWKDADPQTPFLIKAKKDYAALKA